jgi:hypothetical protein
MATIYLALMLPSGSSGQPVSPPHQDGEKGGQPLSVKPIRPCPERGLPSFHGHPWNWWALTPPFHPYPSTSEACRKGGIFSVALSLFRRLVGTVAVSDLPALRGPDFPPPCKGGGRHHPLAYDYFILRSTPFSTTMNHHRLESGDEPSAHIQPLSVPCRCLIYRHIGKLIRFTILTSHDMSNVILFKTPQEGADSSVKRYEPTVFHSVFPFNLLHHEL